MSKLVVGTQSEGFEVDALLKSRLLIQANSGGGKSYVLRKLAEECFARVQTIIIDPEGEFATLRERFGYVLVGKGGETPADTRSAGLLAEKLLELHASAVCDLYEMKPDQRHLWVSKFVLGLMNAPRELWHPVIVVVDEAHKFCPERGKGESEAKEALLTLATAGRKRGFCAVFATQRLGKLDKDAAAELLNVLIGRTFLDVDRDRAADILGVGRSERQNFDETLRNLQPGQFYAFGPAITTKPTLLKVGTVKTTHPEAGTATRASKETPTPDQVKSFLPKLADLPKAAEDRARTEAELRTEIRSLKSQLAAKPKPELDESAVQRAVESAVTQRDREYRQQLSQYQAVIEKLQSGMVAVGKISGQFVSVELPKERHAPIDIPLPPRRTTVVTSRPVRASREVEPVGDLTGPEQRIINAIAWLNSIGVDDPEQTAVAFLAGYSIGGGAFNNPRGALRSKGLVDYMPGERIRLTDEGQNLAQVPDVPLDAEELQQRVLERLPGPEQKILRVLLEHREGLSNEELAELAGYAHGGGAYNNPRGRLRTLGLIDYIGGKVMPRPLLFLENDR